MKNLFNTLQTAKSEEDVKDIYIKHLKLNVLSKNLLDIQTKEIWFEAKKNPTSIYEMFTQLIYYIKKAKQKGEDIPPFLCVVDNEKAGLMETKNIYDLLEDKSIEWEKAKSGSKISSIQIDKVSKYIGIHMVVYNLEHYEDEFKTAISTAINKGYIVRTEITPNNLKQVFDRWVDLIGKEIVNAKTQDYVLFFYADIMSDGKNPTHELDATIILKNNKTAFALNNSIYDLGNVDGYKKFWTLYNRPPQPEYRTYLLERRDSLIQTDERKFKGAYYTPLNVVDKAYDYLNNYLGKSWQKDYVVWDMCCGVGNLEVKHSNHRNIFMSTLDIEDINIMNSAKICVPAERFAYDYLNDDITQQGTIDYSLTNKVPKKLQQAILDGKKILVLINPPYAEATNSSNTSGKNVGNKIGVAKTKVAQYLMDDYGKATNELFTQFVARIIKEIPNCTLAMFSTLKYVNSPNFEKFREHLQAKYKGGFITHSKSFEGLSGNFPIGFLIWDLAKKLPITSISTQILAKNTEIGNKNFYNLPSNTYLNKWIERPKANSEVVVPLSNAVSVRNNNPRVINWSNDAIAHMCCAGNDLQNASKLTFLLSSAVGRGDAMYINEKNLLKASCVFMVRKIIKPTWINDRDQFLQPTAELSTEFYLDCLIYMLFHNSNLTASVNALPYNGNLYNIVNHFVPFCETDVGSSQRFESDFMYDFLQKQSKKLSKEAKNVLNAGKEIYKLYYTTSFNYKIKEEFKLNRADVGYYQIRKSLETFYKNNEENKHYYNNLIQQFKILYNELKSKLHPQVYDLGFLKE